jgi:hypothetical protein
MEHLLGKVEAYLSEKEIEVSNELVSLINTRIKPPLPVKKEEIHIRAMYLVSDQVNSFGGCFPLDEHPRLAQLLVDSPVLIGHSRERLPIARNFKADLVKKDGANWIKVYFYWLKNSPEANSLKDNIDHGIYKECSIGFSFEFPECSICSQDMRRCPHIPFRTYEKETGEKAQAHYNYRNIVKVHETSLVYRGAVFGTSLTNELELFQKHDCADGVCKFKRAYGESILESLRKAGIEKDVRLKGEMAEQGYTEDKIELSCKKELEDEVLSSLPLVFRNRVRFAGAEDENSFQPAEFVLQYHPEDKTELYRLKLKNESNLSVFSICRLDFKKLEQGKRFLCDWPSDGETGDPSDNGEELLDRGKCKKADETKDSFNLEIEGESLRGNYLLRKIKLKGKPRWLFYQMAGQSSPPVHNM